MHKVLLVEDDKEIAQIETDYLAREGYLVKNCYSGEEVLQDFKVLNPDVVILDINLPGIDGYTLCSRIRSISPVPIIIVTSRSTEADELRGLNIGADDFVKKPFSPKVLVTRVKTLLKRPEITESSGSLQIGSLEFDLDSRQLKKAGKVINLTTVQYTILLKLALNRGRVYSRGQLVDAVAEHGHEGDIFDRTIDSHIKNIRKLIEDNPKDPEYVITIRDMGYKFNEKQAE